MRGVCVDETVNYRDDIFAELIVDRRGIHVDPYMLRLVRKIKGERRLLLVSDACVFDGPIPPGYDGVTDINFDFAGEIARFQTDAGRRLQKHDDSHGLFHCRRFPLRVLQSRQSARFKGERRAATGIRCGHRPC